ncbi:MAG: hypothetical protein KKG00_14365 [Bacteroidetes bacterium]|nr:hypothetical protein [Bacteroidota bacterium]
MEDANSIVPAEVRIGTTTISLGLHHGEPVTGKPIFLQVRLIDGDELLTGFEEGTGKLVLENDGWSEELILETTREGLMKKFTFPSPGEYKATVYIRHRNYDLDAQFAIRVGQGDDRDSPVG